MSQWRWTSFGFSSLQDPGSEAGHWGIRRFVIPDTGFGYSFASISATRPQVNVDDIQYLYLVVRVPTAPGQATLTAEPRFGIGLAQDASDFATASPNFGLNGIALMRADPQFSGNWHIRRENGGTGAIFDTQPATIDEWIECKLTNQGGGTWGVLLNGVTYGPVTGAPTNVNLLPAIWVRTVVAGTTPTFDVDEFTIALKAANPRFT